jgi:hypothetical protein
MIKVTKKKNPKIEENKNNNLSNLINPIVESNDNTNNKLLSNNNSMLCNSNMINAFSERKISTDIVMNQNVQDANNSGSNKLTLNANNNDNSYLNNNNQQQSAKRRIVPTLIK